MDEAWLVEQCLKGKTAYWNALVRKHRQRMVDRIAFAISSAEDAPVIVDEALDKARHSLNSFRHQIGQLPDGSRLAGPLFFTWLCTFAAEPATQFMRNRKQ